MPDVIEVEEKSVCKVNWRKEILINKTNHNTLSNSNGLETIKWLVDIHVQHNSRFHIYGFDVTVDVWFEEGNWIPLLRFIL